MKKVIIDSFFSTIDISITLGILSFSVKVQKSSSSLLNEIRLLEDHIYENREDYLKEEQYINNEIYKRLGKDPKRYPNSANALIKRIQKGKSLYHIYNVVDCNNYLSLLYGISIGSYDISKIKGDIFFTKANSLDTYKGIGKDNLHLENLPILKDEEGPFGSPTSDSEKAMIQKDTKKVLMIFYDMGSQAKMEEILKKAREILSIYCNATDFEENIVFNKIR